MKTKTWKAPNKRALRDITRELQKTLKRGTAAVIDAGKLLIRAQDLFDDHKDFLFWALSKFGLSRGSTYNYVNAAKFALKFPKFGNFHFTKAAMYFLGGRGADLAPEVIEAIFAEAKTRWVDEERCLEIAEPPKPPMKETPEDSPQADTPVEPDAEKSAVFDPNAVLDGASPDLPSSPPPESSVRDEALRKMLRDTVKNVKMLMTKPATKFAGVEDQNDLIEAADFFNDLAKRKQIIKDLEKENTDLRARHGYKEFGPVDGSEAPAPVDASTIGDALATLVTNPRFGLGDLSGYIPNLIDLADLKKSIEGIADEVKRAEKHKKDAPAAEAVT